MRRPEVATLTERYQQQLAALRAAVARAVAAAWDGLTDYRDDKVGQFVAQVVPVVEGGQARSVALTDAYLALRTARDPWGLTLAGLDLRAGTPLTEVYRRPFVSTWTALSRGAAIVDAVSAGRSRASSSAEMDVALATRASAAEAMRRDGRVVGYRRVPSGGACDLCLLASQQQYSVEDLMPLHNRCGCTVEPIIGDSDPGAVMDSALLGQLDAARAAGTRAAVRQHGELGPVVVNARDAFTTDI